jgi:stage II sporulation protein D
MSITERKYNLPPGPVHELPLRTAWISCVGRLSLLILLLLRAGSLFSIDLKVGLFHDYLVQSALFTVVEGRYTASWEGAEHVACEQGSSWFILHRDDSLYFRDPRGNWHTSRGIRFAADGPGVFSLKPADPAMDTREYNGELRVGISMKSLQMINSIDLERYVMGVVESEAGPSCPLEYYKVQAVICRTFALKNIDRHKEEGFNLCDGVHCQSYRGRNIWNEDVEIGTEVTDGLVLCDEDTVLINPVFHANSGGETRGAGKAWLKEEPYLQPVLDPFSVGQPNATWERSMQVRDWIMYLLSYGIRFPEKADTAALEMHMKHRQDYYRVFGDSIPVAGIRDDFSYRSEFFDVLVEGNMIRIKGKGYGHGVGLSQEGAMEMARRRYHYTAILNYYYYGILIIPYFEVKELFSQGIFH